MYTLSEQQIDFILNDIKTRGVEMEDLQLNLLDHICCIIERELQSDDDFQQFYQQIIPRFFNKELKEIEEEIILLLTFKNYFAMKNVMIKSGCISAFLLIVGSVFKVLHLPGAGISLVLGIAILSLLFLPLVFILKTRDDSTSRDKLVLGLGTLIGIFFSWATLFKVMHWPNGDGILWFLAIGTSAFLLIPLYFFTGIRDPNIRLNTVVTTIMLLGGTGLLFSLVNIQPSFKQSLLKMSSYAQSEDLLKKLQCRNTKSPNALTADINRTAEEIKGFVLENMIGQPSLPKDFKERNLVADDSNLGEGIDDPEKGKQLFSHLKEAVLKYNAHQGEVENKIPTELFQLEKMGSYSKYAFLNSIVQLQMYLATNENRKDCK